MSSMIIWCLGLAASAGGLVVTAGMKLFYVHMLLAALVAILVALASYAEIRSLSAADAAREAVAAIGLRHAGLVWSWGALVLLVTYAFGVLQWREWWTFFTAFFVLAGLCLFMAVKLREAAAAGGDEFLLKLARGLAVFLLVAMLLTMAGLAVDGKLWRFTTVAGLRRGSEDWGANDVFFFGALAISAITANLVRLTAAAAGSRRSEAA